MNLNSILKKRTYEYLFYKFSPLYYKSKKNKLNQTVIESLEEILNVLKLEKFNEVIVLASGPSSKNVKFSNNNLYLTTNDSYKMLDEENFIYLIQDKFITLRYLKMFLRREKWLATFCIVNNNGFKGNKDVFLLVQKYLSKYNRNDREFLISDINETAPHNNMFKELNSFLKKEFNFDFVTLNSGFTLLLLSTYIAYKLDKPLKVFGLDYGEGGHVYFNGKKISHNHCSFVSANKEKTKLFLNELYKSSLNVKNYSFFMQKK